MGSSPFVASTRFLYKKKNDQRRAMRFGHSLSWSEGVVDGFTVLQFKWFGFNARLQSGAVA
jgi:hypothetical protein